MRKTVSARRFAGMPGERAEPIVLASLSPVMNRCLSVTTVFIVSVFATPALAEPLAAAVNGASLSSLMNVPLTAPAKDAHPAADPAIVRLQVLLDRAGASPGVIDGIDGDNVRKALAGFETMSGLVSDGRLDAATIGQLEAGGPIVASYTVSGEDAGDLVDHIPDDYGEKARMASMGYTSVAEKLAERFHMDIDLLKALNPTAAFTPGTTLQVVMPGAFREARVDHIKADKKRGQVFAYARDGALLAVYPATVGSDDNPSPKGVHEVKGVARMPVYRYDPAINFKQGRNNKVLTIPKGPNGPVGSIWIDLTEPTYGIHGTPDPELIGKVGSHGCVRLTNWDAEELAGMVKPGVVVTFVD